MDYLEVMRAGSHSETFRQTFILRLRLLILSFYQLSLVAPEMQTLIPAATGFVISQAAQLYQPVIISQPAIQVDGV